jgi:hypothetical protein
VGADVPADAGAEQYQHRGGSDPPCGHAGTAEPVRDGEGQYDVDGDGDGPIVTDEEDECLNINVFWSLAHARTVIGDWRRDNPG